MSILESLLLIVTQGNRKQSRDLYMRWSHRFDPELCGRGFGGFRTRVRNHPVDFERGPEGEKKKGRYDVIIVTFG